MKEYKECFVAFLDILGFKNLISYEECEKIYSIFSLIKQNSRTTLKLNEENIDAFELIKYKVMSDSIILYIESDIPDAFFALIRSCQNLQMLLLGLDKPILLRGGIEKGNLFVENDIIFGPGLTAAYLIESNISTNPRIVFSNKILEKGRTGYKRTKIGIDGISFYKDVDEFNVINFMSFELFLNLNYSVVYFDRIMIMCQKYIDDEKDLHVRNKYLWLKEESIKLAKNKKRIFELTDSGKDIINKWNV